MRKGLCINQRRYLSSSVPVLPNVRWWLVISWNFNWSPGYRISFPGESSCFGRWALWHYSLMRSPSKKRRLNPQNPQRFLNIELKTLLYSQVTENTGVITVQCTLDCSLYVHWVLHMLHSMHVHLSVWFRPHIYPGTGPWFQLLSEHVLVLSSQ